MVSTPLKHISQLGLLFPIYETIKTVPNHQPVWHPIGRLFWHFFWRSIWHSLWLLAEVRQCPLRSCAHVWGPSVPTWDLESAVEVRQCPMISWARGWGRGEEAGKSVIKSRDPDLARGENNQILGIDYCINIYQHPRNHVNVITTSSQYMYMCIYI